jgi:hypothetical protein
VTVYLHRAGEITSATVAHELAQPAAVVLTRTMYVPDAEAEHHDDAIAAEHGLIGDGPWWHAYGAQPDSGEWAGCWVAITVGPIAAGPTGHRDNGQPITDPLTVPHGGTLPYLASWDHEPSDEEKGALEPDDDPAPGVPA